MANHPYGARDLVTRTEIARMAGVDTRTVAQWAYRSENGSAVVRFPRPVRRLDGDRVTLYRRVDVEAYLVRTGRLPIAADEVAEVLRVEVLDVFELVRLRAIPAPSYYADDGPRWQYPVLRTALVADSLSRAFLLGDIDLERWRELARLEGSDAAANISPAGGAVSR